MKLVAIDVPRGHRFTPEELAVELKTTPEVLQKWRTAKRGPMATVKEQRYSGRAGAFVEYAIEDVEAWLSSMPWTRGGKQAAKEEGDRSLITLKEAAARAGYRSPQQLLAAVKDDVRAPRVVSATRQFMNEQEFETWQKKATLRRG